MSKSCGGGDQHSGSKPRPDKPAANTKAAWLEDAEAIIKRNDAAVSAYRACLSGSLTGAECSEPKLEEVPAWVEGVVPQPALTPPPQVVAYTAAARLKLEAPRPIIGPPPNINPWKIAAVGYPLWLSTDADLDPPAVSDSVYDLSVKVKARLSRVVFAMGDGETVICTDLSQSWTRAVEPGTPSPTCGYRYTKPPRGSRTYTVTAHAYWSVTVTINGTAYPVTLAQHSSVQLPVGELQVVVR